MSGVFVDTGGWIALFRRDDAHHDAAAAFYSAALDDGALLVTSNYVTDETATRMRYDIGLPAALRFRDSMQAAVSARRLRIAWVDQAIEREAWSTMERFADIGLSFTDATSAVLAHRAKIERIFGFDGDFRALGFDVQPVFVA